MADKVDKKYGVIVAHGVLDRNLRNFIVPEGYSFVFLVRSGEASSNHYIFECDLAEEVFEHNMRGFLSGEQVHEYNAGDLVQEHTISFDANLLHNNNRSEPNNNKFLTTGIYGENESLPHQDGRLKVYYQAEGEKEEDAYHFNEVAFPNSDERNRLKGKSLALSNLCYQLKPGGYIIHICRSLPKVLEESGVELRKSTEDLSSGFKDNTRAITIYSRDKFKDKLIELCQILLGKNDSESNNILKTFLIELQENNNHIPNSKINIKELADPSFYSQEKPIIISNIFYLYLTSFGQFQSPKYYGVNGGGKTKKQKTKKRKNRNRKKMRTKNRNNK